MNDTELEKQINFAETNLQRQLDWIGRYDSRIAFVAGISIAMLGVLAKAGASVSVWTCYEYLIFLTPGILLIMSLLKIYFAQYPKTESPNFSLIFFGTIASLKFDEFKKKFKESTSEEHLDDLLCQTHINAQILNGKFEFLKTSLFLILISAIPWAYALYISQLYIK